MILDLFAGPGGWSEGLRMVGASDVGVENDATACATRHAAGHRTIRADVTQLARVPFRDKVDGLILSPPCRDFSRSGLRAGIEGETGQLMWQIPLWVRAIRPRWVACEQVPPALEWFERFAYEFETLGYRTWRGVLNAADYGVPQTRNRAMLLAALDMQPRPPESTHARNPKLSLFGNTLQPWVSMADALGWEWAALHTNRDFRDGEPRQQRCVDEPAPTVAGGGKQLTQWTLRSRRDSQRWIDRYGQRSNRTLNEPGPCITGEAFRWPWERPCTTLQGDARAFSPGSHINNNGGDNSKMIGRSENAVRLTVRDALTLQSFDPDYPVQGSKTKQFEQVGNAVPPLLAAHVLHQFTESTGTARGVGFSERLATVT